jgi:predicted aldo/keto reductase-like oxidoreductase
MPCPGGVNIPLCFESYNNLYMSDNADEAGFLYAARLIGTLSVGGTEFVSRCIQCVECLESVLRTSRYRPFSKQS